MASRFQLRQRLRGRFSKLVGAEDPATAPVPAPSPAVVAPAPAPPAPPPTAAPAVAPKVVAKVDPPSPDAAASAAEAGPEAEEEARLAARAVRHLARTRHGLMGFLVESGGTSDLGALHDRSERKYFVGHKKFSDLMESMIEDGHITYDHGDGIARITDAGRALAASPRP